MITFNDYKIQPTIFPDGTSQVWKLPDELFNVKNVDIIWDFENEAEIFHLCQLVQLIRCEVNYSGFKCLHMPFLPFGRQDKYVKNSSTFALYTFASIINNLGFDYVSTLDAHSSTASDLIINLDDIFPEKEIKFAKITSECDTLCFPDKGAKNRYSKMITKSSIIGDKVRDRSTGYILKYDFEGEVKDKNILIVDDICDGGMTFKILSESLLKNGANCVNLYITHGIFSKGIQTLKDSGISKIFTLKGEIK